jgi:hypothetical protein
LTPAAEGPDLRFPGLSPATRAFFQAVDREPCPTSWPGADRVAYVAHVLGPLKALVGDLDRELAGSTPRIKLEPRVGASLAWPREVAPDSADCPVRCIRAWIADEPRTRSPLLTVTFLGKAIEVALEAAGGDPGASDRVHDAILGPDEEARILALTLLRHGWHPEGPRGPDLRTVPGEGERTAAAMHPEQAKPLSADDIIPDDLHPYFEHDSVRLVRRLAWEPWLEEPSFALEVADLFRELLPLLALMEAPAPRRAADKARLS